MPSEPLILAFDTSAAHCAAALLSGEHLLATRHEDMTKGQAERLLPLIDEVLEQAHTDVGALSAIAVGIGPGNFTGIRISVSAARGLALSLGIPAIGVNAFDALAFGAGESVLTSVDARRGMSYLSGPDGMLPKQISPQDLPDDLRGSGLNVIGHNAAEFAGLTGGCALPAAFSAAEAIARVASTKTDQTHPRPAPLYLRPADAAPPSDPAPTILP